LISERNNFAVGGGSLLRYQSRQRINSTTASRRNLNSFDNQRVHRDCMHEIIMG